MMQEFLELALDEVSAAGASYGDVRIVESASQSVAVKGPAVESLDSSQSLGIGIRVLCGGAWGFAATASLDRAEVVRAARTAVAVGRASALVSGPPVELAPERPHDAVWAGPIERDPFAVPLDDKIGLLAGAATIMEAVPGIRAGRATMDFVRQVTWFASSEGSRITQTIVHSGAGIEALAVDGSEVQQRSYPASFRGHMGAGGYEIVESLDLAGNAERTAHEAVALVRAPECPDVVTTVVLDGNQMMLQVHESVGHPTELDRILGMEAGFAGTSFVDLSDVGRLRYGSDAVTIVADATVPGGLGTYAYDDEGVTAQRIELVRNGILTGFQTSRETAAAAGDPRSNGCMRAEGWENFPLIRMPNVNLMPGAGSLDDLMADVGDGVYMATNRSWSIDDKRMNFQFGCEIAWEIKGGRLRRMLKNPRYTGITPEFWRSCDAVAGPEEWEMRGTPNCGKGQPGQTMRVGHGTAPARFRDVATGTSH